MWLMIFALYNAINRSQVPGELSSTGQLTLGNLLNAVVEHVYDYDASRKVAHWSSDVRMKSSQVKIPI